MLRPRLLALALTGCATSTCVTRAYAPRLPGQVTGAARVTELTLAAFSHRETADSVLAFAREAIELEGLTLTLDDGAAGRIEASAPEPVRGVSEANLVVTVKKTGFRTEVLIRTRLVGGQEDEHHLAASRLAERGRRVEQLLRARLASR